MKGGEPQILEVGSTRPQNYFANSEYDTDARDPGIDNTDVGTRNIESARNVVPVQSYGVPTTGQSSTGKRLVDSVYPVPLLTS